MDRKDIITDMDDPRRCEPGEVERLKNANKQYRKDNNDLMDLIENKDAKIKELETEIKGLHEIIWNDLRTDIQCELRDMVEPIMAQSNKKDARIKQLEDRNKLLSRDNINLRKFIVDSRNKLSDFITSDLEDK